MGILGKAGSVFLGVVIGYGYYPWRALWFMGVFVLGGTIIFNFSDKNNLLANKKAEFQLKGSPIRFPYKLNPIVYSIDTFVPLINLGQADHWIPVHPLLRFYLWIHVSAGWVLSTLLAFALAGLVKG